MTDPIRWLALGYSVPVNPSKNRVYVWRKLKEFGAEYFKQGVALLPYTKQSYLRFRHLSAKIVEMGGEASIVEMKFLDAKDEKEIVAKFREQAMRELSELGSDCTQVLADLKQGQILDEEQMEEIKKIIRRYSKAKSRNHFAPAATQEVERGIYAIISASRQLSAEVAAQFAKAMDKALK